MQNQASKIIRLRAWRAVDAVVGTGLADHHRARLAFLIPAGQGEIAVSNEAPGRKLLLQLARALRSERSRGRAGHWTYDLNRHIGLAQAYRAEKQRLEIYRKGAKNRAARKDDPVKPPVSNHCKV